MLAVAVVVVPKGVFKHKVSRSYDSRQRCGSVLAPSAPAPTVEKDESCMALG